MAQDPIEIWNGEIPDASAVALRDVAFRATRAAFTICKERFIGYPINYIAGQWRFTELQYRMLEFGTTDPVLKSRALFHVNRCPFTQLYTAKIQITSATVESENAYPQISLFREEEQARQMEFFKNHRVLIAHLCLSFGNDISAPATTRVHFPDGRGGYLEPYIDLMAIAQKTPILPVEHVKGNNKPHERGDEAQTEHDGA